MPNLLQRQDAYNILEHHLAGLKNIFSESLEELNRALNQITVPVNKRGKTSTLHSICVSKIKLHYEGNPDIIIKEKYESIQIVFDKKIVGRVKKIDNKNLSKNATSKRNNNILSQQLSIFPEADLTFVDFGYIIDPTWTDYDNLIVVCRINDTIAWQIPFKTTESIRTVETIQTEIQPIETETQITIRRAQ